MRKSPILVSLLLLAASFSALALQPETPFAQYDRTPWFTEHGLPQTSVMAITQDHAGYLWFGTQGGLGRFDGLRFTTYTSHTAPGLPGNWIHALDVGPDGRLWVGTYKGLAVRDRHGFTAVPAADAERWPELDVQAVEAGDDGSVLVGTTSGLFELAGDVLHPVEGAPEAASALTVAGDVLWVGGEGSVHRRDAGGWQAMPLPTDARVLRLAHAQGRIWVGTSRGLYVSGEAGWRVPEGAGALSEGPVPLLRQDGDGNLWAGGATGLARIRGGEVVEFVADGDPGAIGSPNTAFEDRERNLWIGSASEGSVRLSDSRTRTFSVGEGLHAKTVWSVSPDPDGRRIWVGTADGLAVLEDGRFRLVVPGSDLASPHVTSVLAEDGRVWLGTLQGLWVLDQGGPHAGKARRLPGLEAVDKLYLSGLVRTSDGDLWLNSNDGLFRWDGSRLRRYGRDDGLATTHVRYLFQASDGRIWVGTKGGLFRMQDGRFEPAGTDTGLPGGLDVLSIGELPGGRLVIGALSEHVYFQHGGRWHEAAEGEGFPRNALFVLQPQAGYMWVSGMEGIGRIPLEDFAALAEGRSTQLRTEPLLSGRTQPNGAQVGNCCNGVGTSSGFLQGTVFWVPTDNGLRALDTTRLALNTVPPLLAIERVQLNDEWQEAVSVAGTELASDVRDLAFEFAVLSFQDPKSNKVEYRLRGYDQQWRKAEAGVRETRYTNLPGGDYVFEVRGTNNSGVAAAAPVELRFAVGRRFHETFWFPLALVALAFALVYAGYRYQRHRQLRQQSALEALVRQRTAALELSHQQLEDANERLEQASLTDPLTGLRNRRHISAQLPADLAFYDRRLALGEIADEVLVFALVDVDHFKAVNDEYGHRAGDLVLQQVAQLLTGMVRSGDYVARWGGEEFLLVFRPMPMDQLATLGDRLRSTIGNHRFDLGDGNEARLTASIGLSEYPLFRLGDEPLGWEAMVDLADQAMYYVKARGRDGWAAFRPTTGTRVDTLLRDLQADADALVARGELELLGRIPG